MPIEFNGRIHISNVYEAISLPHDADAKFLGDLTIQQAQYGVVVRDPPSALSSLGLPPDTPPELVVQALQILKAHAAATHETKVALLKRSWIGSLLQDVTNATTIAGNLISLSTSMYAEQAIEFFRNLIPRN